MNFKSKLLQLHKKVCPKFQSNLRKKLQIGKNNFAVFLELQETAKVGYFKFLLFWIMIGQQE